MINITMKTVHSFKRIMRPLAENGIVSLSEYNETISQLTSLAEHGTLKSAMLPRLIAPKEATEMLGI